MTSFKTITWKERYTYFRGKYSTIKAWHKLFNLMQKGSKEVIWNTKIIIGFKIGYGEGKYGIDIHNRHRSSGWKED